MTCESSLGRPLLHSLPSSWETLVILIDERSLSAIPTSRNSSLEPNLMQKVCQVGKMLGQRHVREEDVAEADIKKEHGARRVEHGWRSIPLV